MTSAQRLELLAPVQSLGDLALIAYQPVTSVPVRRLATGVKA